MFSTILLPVFGASLSCSLPLPLFFNNVCANQVSQRLCVCACVCMCFWLRQHVSTLHQPVCVCVWLGEALFLKRYRQRKERVRNLISQSGSRLAGWVGCGGWGRAVTTEERIFFWLATHRPITIHKQTKTTLYTNDPVWVCVCVCVRVCVWKEGEK